MGYLCLHVVEAGSLSWWPIVLATSAKQPVTYVLNRGYFGQHLLLSAAHLYFQCGLAWIQIVIMCTLYSPNWFQQDTAPVRHPPHSNVLIVSHVLLRPNLFQETPHLWHGNTSMAAMIGISAWTKTNVKLPSQVSFKIFAEGLNFGSDKVLWLMKSSVQLL